MVKNANMGTQGELKHQTKNTSCGKARNINYKVNKKYSSFQWQVWIGIWIENWNNDNLCFPGTWSSPLRNFCRSSPTSSLWVLATSCSPELLQVIVDNHNHCKEENLVAGVAIENWISPSRSGTRCCWGRHHGWSGRPRHHHLSCGGITIAPQENNSFWDLLIRIYRYT